MKSAQIPRIISTKKPPACDLTEDWWFLYNIILVLPGAELFYVVPPGAGLLETVPLGALLPELLPPELPLVLLLPGA